MKLLIVDDSRTMRNIVKKGLEALGGIEFSEAGDGADALKVIGATPGGFDLVTVDWNMPVMDGITLLHRIREKDKKTPVIMVTTEAEKARVMEAVKAGANNYVVKPFTPETLLEKVTQTINKTKMAA